MLKTTLGSTALALLAVVTYGCSSEGGAPAQTGGFAGGPPVETGSPTLSPPLTVPTAGGASSPSGGSANTGGGAPSGGSPASGGGVVTATGGSGGSGGVAGAPGAGSTQGGMAGTLAGGTANTGGMSGGAVGSGGLGDGGTSAGGAGGSSGNGAAVFHVFLLLGQSNMAGYSPATSEDKLENERIQVLGFDTCAATGRKSDQWDVAAPPLHECGPGALGPGDYFAKTLLQTLPTADTIGLVPCALSGQRVEVFSKGTEKYTWIINRAKNAQALGGVIEGLLFHQGESNCGDSAWPGKVQKFVSDLRADLKLGEVPFLAGELPRASACNNHNPLVNQLPGLIPNAFVISSEGLELDPSDTQWRMHFGRPAQVEFGKRYEAKFLEASTP